MLSNNHDASDATSRDLLGFRARVVSRLSRNELRQVLKLRFERSGSRMKRQGSDVLGQRDWVVAWQSGVLGE